MNMITQAELIQAMEVLSGAHIASFNVRTIPDLIKTDNPWWIKEGKRWTLRKMSRVNGVLNANYSKSVNRAREKEGKEADFEAQPRQWGERVQGTPLVFHKDKDGKDNWYLEIRINSVPETRYYDTVENCTVENELVRPFLPKRQPSKTQDLDKEVILRTYKIANVVSITWGGQDYMIVDVDD